MKKSKARRILKMINFYPPYFAAGIKLRKINQDLTQLHVEMKLTWFNRNLFGTHFGGSLYAMCDPFYVFIIFINLGEEYIVWDKSAAIKFLRPGKGRVRAVFEVAPEYIEQIRSEVDLAGKKTYHFTTQVLNEQDKVVAQVTKEIYVRKK